MPLVAVIPKPNAPVKLRDVRGCCGSDFSHFYRAAQIISDQLRSRPWGAMRANLSRYKLAEANEALAAVSEGRVLKALISPES